MNKLKVAVLEDNKRLLKELKDNLIDSGLVNVVATAINSEDFYSKVNNSKPDALILDIDLNGDSMNGLDIANDLKLPVLFTSGKTRDFFSNIEELNLNSDQIVEHISKPITIEKLEKILPKFIKQVRSLEESQCIYLDFKESKRNKILIDDIVFLDSDKIHGAKSNNKRIYFTNRKPQTLVDFSFSKMEAVGFSKNQFIKTHKSFRVNTSHIMRYESSEHNIIVEAIDLENKKNEFRLYVSENYRKNVRRKPI